MTSFQVEFPRLTPANYRQTSPVSHDYNCVAWAADDVEHWWQPGIYWPVELTTEQFGIAFLKDEFRALGYEGDSQDDSLESGFEKVALYGSTEMYTHAARQLPSGKWTSKLGGGIDIEHDRPGDVAGGIYGEVYDIMKRPLTSSA